MDNSSRPANAALIGLVGGAITLLTGLYEFSPLLGDPFGASVLVGTNFWAILEVVSAYEIYQVKHRKSASVALIIFALITMPGYFTYATATERLALSVGVVLAIIGGALGLTWKPSPMPVMASQPTT